MKALLIVSIISSIILGSCSKSNAPSFPSKSYINLFDGSNSYVYTDSEVFGELNTFYGNTATNGFIELGPMTNLGNRPSIGFEFNGNTHQKTGKFLPSGTAYVINNIWYEANLNADSSKLIFEITRINNTEKTWVGDFNIEMVNINDSTDIKLISGTFAVVIK